MDKKEIKKLIKPLVKECIREMLLEEGLLSSLISEVNKGNKQIFSESSRREPAFVSPKQTKPQINEVRKKLADSIGKGAYGNVFEGLEPAPGPGELGVDDGDPGMDLSMLNKIPGLKGFK
jgi:hypothetical protein